MDARVRPAPNEIRLARADNPKMRERDLAAQLGISEAEFVAAHCGDGALRIEPRVNDVLTGLEAVGEVMALTRNESAVHEKIGVYDKVVTGNHNALVLGEQIDLRIFPKIWAHGFAVEKRDGDEIRRSLQFFDGAGEAVHKVHLRPAPISMPIRSWSTSLASPTSGRPWMSRPGRRSAGGERRAAGVDELRERWSRLTDVHQFFGMLKALKLTGSRRCGMVGQDYAWLLDRDALGAMLQHAASAKSRSCASSATAAASRSIPGRSRRSSRWGRGSTFSTRPSTCICRTDHIRELWAVRKPTNDGHVTSLEAYDARRQHDHPVLRQAA